MSSYKLIQPDKPTKERDRLARRPAKTAEEPKDRPRVLLQVGIMVAEVMIFAYRT